MLRLFYRCLGKYRIFAVLAPLCVTLEVVFEVLIPKVMTNLIDNGVMQRDMPYIMRTGSLMIFLAGSSLLFGSLSAILSSTAATGFAKGLRGRLFNSILDFSHSNVDRFTTPSLITRTTTDVDNLQRTLMMTLRMAVRSPVMLVFSLSMAFSLNARLALIFLAAIPIMAAALALIVRAAFPVFGELLKRYDGLNAMVQESLIAIRVVKSFVREGYEIERFDEAAGQLRDMQRKAEKRVILNMPVMQFVMYACMIFVSWFGGVMIIGGSMTTGKLMGLLSYVSQILFSLMMLSMFFVTLVLSRASLTRVLGVLRERPDITDDRAEPDAQMSDAGIVFDNVGFAYQNAPPIFKDLNLEIKSGTTVGIIGGTGSGKSSLVSLIPRLYDVTQGAVKLGGRDVRQYPLSVLRKNVSIVLQNNLLFSGTIRENLLWGDGDAGDEQLVDACKTAQAHDFIMSFPDGYDTLLGQGGVNLSGGQRQRLCIARALVRRPKILIFDDSTSALDTHTDSLLRARLKEHMAGSTVVIIAQRLESVKDADLIVVMDDGSISDMGTHQTLLKSSSIYQEVYQSQQKGVLEVV
jgi:ATP-binding cassette subfamily B multidrug efflux pump